MSYFFQMIGLRDLLMHGLGGWCVLGLSAWCVLGLSVVSCFDVCFDSACACVSLLLLRR